MEERRRGGGMGWRWMGAGVRRWILRRLFGASKTCWRQSSLGLIGLIGEWRVSTRLFISWSKTWRLLQQVTLASAFEWRLLRNDAKDNSKCVFAGQTSAILAIV